MVDWSMDYGIVTAVLILKSREVKQLRVTTSSALDWFGSGNDTESSMHSVPNVSAGSY